MARNRPLLAEKDDGRSGDETGILRNDILLARFATLCYDNDTFI